jgi:hypothetical protein
MRPNWMAWGDYEIVKDLNSHEVYVLGPFAQGRTHFVIKRLYLCFIDLIERRFLSLVRSPSFLSRKLEPTGVRSQTNVQWLGAECLSEISMDLRQREAVHL